uniref:hypothetical protein n=1 Tax=Rhodococcus oryzae TaxID=2571143 RepID=UPI001FE82645|nr:hypothetical protein [Rhodococcus oryzae]
MRDIDRTSSLLLTKPDIAALAKVQRPVVSMWAKRYRDGDRPFPKPVSTDGRQEKFSGTEVVDWIRSRNLGNSDTLAEDLALHAALDHGSALSRDVVFNGISALLCMKAMLGESLADLDAPDLLDEADELDPDDEFLYGEIESLGGELGVFASFADQMADAAYTPAQAFETIMAQRFRLQRADLVDSALAAPALELCARVCAALTADDRAVFVDPSVAGSDLLVALRSVLPEYGEPMAMTGEAPTAASRLARRRLAVHHWRRRRAPEGGFGGGFVLDEPAMFLTQYPSPCGVGMTDAQILADIDNIALQMGPEHRAVIIGPASALVDELGDRQADAIRSGLVRSDRLRAVFRLPEGLLPARPGLSMALWVLGAADPAVKPADRWTVLADLSAVELDDGAVVGVIADVTASMGTWKSVLTSAFRHGVVDKTAKLLATGGALTPPQTKRVRRPRFDGAAAAGRIVELVDATNLRAGGLLDGNLNLRVEYGEAGGLRMPTAGQLAESRDLKVLPGNRIDESDLETGEGVRVIGAEEVLGGRRVGERVIDRLTLTTRYPSGRYTEPGDLVFCTSPGFGVVVDVEGSSVVVSPARIMRIADPASSGMVPELIARHLLAKGVGARPSGAIRSGHAWKGWEIPRIPPDRVPAVTEALHDLRERRRAATELLDNLDQLTTTLIDGVAHGALTVAGDTETHPERG